MQKLVEKNKSAEKEASEGVKKKPIKRDEVPAMRLWRVKGGEKILQEKKLKMGLKRRFE